MSSLNAAEFLGIQIAFAIVAIKRNRAIAGILSYIYIYRMQGLYLEDASLPPLRLVLGTRG